MIEMTREVTCKITFIEKEVLGDRRNEETKRAYASRIKADDKADHVEVVKIRDFVGKKDITREVHCKITHIYRLAPKLAEQMLEQGKDQVFRTAYADMIMKLTGADHVEITKIRDFVMEVDKKRGKK